MEVWVILLIAFLGLGVAAYLGWYSIQSLVQARLLREASELGAGGDSLEGPVAVYGKVDVIASMECRPVARNVLWYRAVHEVLERSGDDWSWSKTGEEEGTADFTIDSPAGKYLVGEHDPTEVQFARSITKYGGSTGCVGAIFSRHGDTRVRIKWLPESDYLTVVGGVVRRGDEHLLVRSGTVGLLFSPRSPGHAANRETIKGVAGLILAIAIATTVICICIAVA
ncbi:MAG: hypothetical protein ACYTAF_13155 [Planctomycetota bacterium]|jgi:hypothetical protein